MDVVAQIRSLRQMLSDHRIQHERMVAISQVLRDRSRQTRMAAVLTQLTLPQSNSFKEDNQGIELVLEPVESR